MRGLLAFVAGAGIVYLFDPDQGRRRRAMLRDRARSLSSSIQRDLSGQLRHWSNRTRGLVAEARRGERSA